MPDQPLPMSTIFDPAQVAAIIDSAATAVATQLSVSSGWEDDDSVSASLVAFASAINPISGVANLVRYGQWRQTTSGAQVVGVNATRRAALVAQCKTTFWSYYSRCMTSPTGAIDALAYLNELVRRARYAWAAVAEQFELARKVNGQICVELNDALDRAYRIRTAASVAFMVVGSLPIVAAGATAAGATTAAGSCFTLTSTATTGTVLASTGTPWVVACKVAGLGAIYGFFTEIAFNKDDVKRSKAAAVHFNDGATGAATGAGGNMAQTALETWRAREAARIATEARRAANQQIVHNAFERLRADALSRPVNPRALTNEVQRQCSQRLAEHAERNLARVSTAVARSGSVLFIAAGLYSMRGDIATACRGLTAEIDRTR